MYYNRIPFFITVLEDEEKDHEFDRLISNYIGQLGLKTTPERLIQVMFYLDYNLISQWNIISCL